MNACMLFKGIKPDPQQPPDALDINPMGFQIHVFGPCFSSAGLKGWGAQYEAQIPHSSGRDSRPI